MTAAESDRTAQPKRSAAPRFALRSSKWARRGLRLALWLLGLWLALAVLAILLVPWLAPRFLSDQLSQTLGRPVSIGQVGFHPFQGRLRIEALTVGKPAGGEQLGFAQLDLDFSARSLTERALVLDELRLLGPRLSLVRLADGRYDLSDGLKRWLRPSDSPQTGWPRFSLHNIQVEQGQVHFEDRPRGTQHRAEAIALKLPFVSSLPRQAEVWVHPSFSAVVNGAPLSLEGQSQPFSAGHRSELTLALQGLDLAPLQPYLPSNLPLQVRAGKLQTHLRIAFEQPAQGEPSVQVSGTAQLKDLALNASSQPWLSLQGLGLTLDPSEPLQGRYALHGLTLQGLQMGTTPSEPPLALQELALQQVRVDLVARQVHAGALRGSGMDLRVLRKAEGDWQWLDLSAMSVPRADSASAPSDSPAWQFTADALTLDGLSLHWQDKTLQPAQRHTLTQGELHGQNLSNAPGHANVLRLDARLGARLAPSARLQAQGTLQWQPLALQMDVQTQGLPLAAAQPYLAPHLNVVLTQGELSSHGRLTLRQAPPDWQLGYQGALTLGRVRVEDASDASELLRWHALHLRAVDLALSPPQAPRLSLGEVALSDFYSRLVLNAQGELNLAHLLRTPPATGHAHGPAHGPAASPAPASAWPLQIARVTLQNGRLDFSDRFVQPNYSASLSQLAGSIQNLSSAPGTLAQLDLRGQYASNAPVRISARLNPLTQNKFLDLQADVSSVDLVDFSPYAGKYAGYTIDKGKLSLNASYRLENRQLRADNRLFIDQLTFGQKVESPDATQLPVHLAIALLKNNRGEIDLHLPIAGSLDDPQFSIGGLIFRMIGNLFVKVLSSPFAFLGSVFGGAEEISQIDFAPGRALLDDAAVRKLEVLAWAMREREDLRLGIAARADTARDAEGLRQAGLEAALLAEKHRDRPPPAADSPAPELRIAPEEYATYLERAYRQARFPKPRNLLGIPLDLPVQDMEKLLLSSQTVDEEALRALASARAQAAQAWLVEKGQVPLARLFLLPVQTGTAPPATGGTAAPGAFSRVEFSLR